MATNCPQLLNPRACRSALCFRAAVSNPLREIRCNICEKMLHTLIKAESSSDSLVFANSTYQRLSLLLPGTPQNCGANLDKCGQKSRRGRCCDVCKNSGGGGTHASANFSSGRRRYTG